MVDGIKNKEHLLGLTLRQLRQEASKLSVPLYSRKTKAVLIDLIIKYQKKRTEISKDTIDKDVSKNISNPIDEISKETLNTKVSFLPSVIILSA